jgi:hypothetical protein
MGWGRWAYFGIGVLVALWHLRREGSSEPENSLLRRGQVLAIVTLAWLWPVLLLAMLVNPPDKPKGGPPKDPPPPAS